MREIIRVKVKIYVVIISQLSIHGVNYLLDFSVEIFTSLVSLYNVSISNEMVQNIKHNIVWDSWSLKWTASLHFELQDRRISIWMNSTFPMFFEQKIVLRLHRAWSQHRNYLEIIYCTIFYTINSTLITSFNSIASIGLNRNLGHKMKPLLYLEYVCQPLALYICWSPLSKTNYRRTKVKYPLNF